MFLNYLLLFNYLELYFIDYQLSQSINIMNYLEPYKGKNTRHTCPACKTKHSFTLYLNGNTYEPIHPTVGKNNRESKCGNHYTPKQFFIDNPTENYRRGAMHSVSNKTIYIPKPNATPTNWNHTFHLRRKIPQL